MSKLKRLVRYFSKCVICHCEGVIGGFPLKPVKLTYFTDSCWFFKTRNFQNMTDVPVSGVSCHVNEFLTAVVSTTVSKYCIRINLYYSILFVGDICVTGVILLECIHLSPMSNNIGLE